jgi:hypothetical protein
MMNKTEKQQLDKFLTMKHTDKTLNNFLKNTPPYIHKIGEGIIYAEEWIAKEYELFESDDGRKFKIKYYITIGHRDPVEMQLIEVKS